MTFLGLGMSTLTFVGKLDPSGWVVNYGPMFCEHVSFVFGRGRGDLFFQCGCDVVREYPCNFEVQIVELVPWHVGV